MYLGLIRLSKSSSHLKIISVIIFPKTLLLRRHSQVKKCGNNFGILVCLPHPDCSWLRYYEGPKYGVEVIHINGFGYCLAQYAIV